MKPGAQPNIERRERMMLMADGGITMPARLQTARKMAKGRREHFTGQITCGPAEGRTMDVESHTELCVARAASERVPANDTLMPKGTRA